jgi:hypothetical protein
VDVDAITAPLLNATLRAWRAADPLPPDLLALDILRDPTAASPTERGIRLHDLIVSLAATELARLRAAEGSAHGRGRRPRRCPGRRRARLRPPQR